MGKVQMFWKGSFGLLGSAQTAGNQMGETHPLIPFKFGYHCAEILNGQRNYNSWVFLNDISVG